MRVSRIYRLLRLITLLQSGRSYTPDDLAEELQVSKRTVFRDLNALEMAHVPYYFDADRNGYRINGHFFLPPVNLTLAEALAILTLTLRLRDAGRLPLVNQAVKAAMKLETALPSHIRRHVGGVLKSLGMRLGPLANHEGLDATFDDLIDAVARRRVCRIVYDSFFDRKQLRLTVHPLHLSFIGRAWYVIAWSDTHGEARTFKLARIRRLSVGAKEFDPPESLKNFDLDDYFGNAWSMIPEGKLYKVHLHFEPKVAGNVAEVSWHPTQRIEWNTDRSIEYHATVDGLGEIGWWILGYGDQVEVVAPKKLRARIRKTAQAMVEKNR